MLRVYCANPYSGLESNKLSVETKIKELVKINANKVVYISPIHSFGFLYSDTTYEQGIEYCLNLLKECDVLLLLNEETSKGVEIEKEFATKRGMPIYGLDEYKAKLNEWLVSKNEVH